MSDFYVSSYPVHAFWTLVVVPVEILRLFCGGGML